MKFDTEGARKMLTNLTFMIDVERAECAVRAIDREMAFMREGEGARPSTSASRVRCSVAPAGNAPVVDAAACGELEALRALPRDRVQRRRRGGGRPARGGGGAACARRYRPGVGGAPAASRRREGTSRS